MNLELLDPFRRQIPDRVDATLSLPTILHSTRNPQSKEDDDDDWKAANHVSFNRRGTYAAVGYGSGTIAVYDVLSRTLISLFRDHTYDVERYAQPLEVSRTPMPETHHGITSLSWSRRSRTMLAGATGSTEVRLIDTTHPLGPEECVYGLNADVLTRPEDERMYAVHNVPATTTTQDKKNTKSSFRITKPNPNDHFKKARLLDFFLFPTVPGHSAVPKKRESQLHPPVVADEGRKRYPALHVHLPTPVAGSLHIHPRDAYSGLAVLSDGCVVAFSFPPSGWEGPSTNNPPPVRLVELYRDASHPVTCAAFDSKGDNVYAATKDGKLLGFEVGAVHHRLANRAPQTEMPAVSLGFQIHIPGGATAWHLVVSRNGKYLVVNSVDAAIRLYTIKDCWRTPEEVDKPTWVFQDVVSKVKFASCDISGDGEYVVGGSNGSENKYDLYIWNTSTGTLMDKLTGPTVELYSVTWHPTRNFLAVATSDGIVDIWGPRINWTAFAPDFQALPQNVEYVECEDEFDIVEGTKDAEMIVEGNEDEDASVDVLTIDHVPVFASDSEDESEVFHFDTKVKRLVGTL